MKQQIVLIGLPGAGKTTVGALVAETLGCPFVDIDAVIVRRMQMPVSRIFAELGETRFREVERETVNDALAAAPSVIVPGGGWAAQEGNLAPVRASAFVVYLKCMVTTAAKRIEGDSRPLMAGRKSARRHAETPAGAGALVSPGRRRGEERHAHRPADGR